MAFKPRYQEAEGKRHATREEALAKNSLRMKRPRPAALQNVPSSTSNAAVGFKEPRPRLQKPLVFGLVPPLPEDPGGQPIQHGAHDSRHDASFFKILFFHPHLQQHNWPKKE